MMKVEKLRKKANRLQDKIVGLEDKYEEILSCIALRTQAEINVTRAETAKEIYELMTGEFEAYIDTDIAKEIAGRFGVCEAELDHD